MSVDQRTGAPWGAAGPTLEFSDDVSAQDRDVIPDVLGGWEVALFGDGDLRVEPLPGGANNRNYTLMGGGVKYALRIANPQNERLAVDLEAAHQAQRDAAAVGVAPELVAVRMPEGHALSRFVEGRVLDPAAFRHPEVVGIVGRTLRDLHGAPTTTRICSPFEDIRVLASYARSDGTPFPADYPELEHALWEVEALVRGMDLPLAFCHNDTVPQNFILGDRLHLVDWDYGGRSWGWFELAAFIGTAQLSEELEQTLLTAYGVSAGEAEMALIRALQLVAAMREATWAVMIAPVLEGTTTLLEGWSYEQHLEDALAVARGIVTGDRFGRLLEQAKRADVAAAARTP
jgi:thiamine kinase-like enzyme